MNSSAVLRVDAQLPLILLRSVRVQDTPAELLPDESLETFFPKRLGLSGVVEDQIRHFDRLARRRRRVEREQVQALLELIARRPDADAIFEAAGRRLADLRFRGFIGRLRRLTRRLPRALQRRATARGLRAAYGGILVASRLDVSSSPVEMRAIDALTAGLNSQGKACRLYGSLAEGLAELNGAASVEAVHTQCQARGDDACHWVIEYRSPNADRRKPE